MLLPKKINQNLKILTIFLSFFMLNNEVFTMEPASFATKASSTTKSISPSSSESSSDSIDDLAQETHHLKIIHNDDPQNEPASEKILDPIAQARQENFDKFLFARTETEKGHELFTHAYVILEGMLLRIKEFEGILDRSTKASYLKDFISSYLFEKCNPIRRFFNRQGEPFYGENFYGDCFEIKRNLFFIIFDDKINCHIEREKDRFILFLALFFSLSGTERDLFAIVYDYKDFFEKLEKANHIRVSDL